MHTAGNDRRRWLATAVVLAATLAVTGCGGDDSSSTDDSGSTDGTPAQTAVGDTLTIAGTFGLVSLDPAKANADPTGVMTTELAYQPLIRMNADGEYEPGLAESWKYVGSGNKVFEFTLRDSLEFSDGTPVTAKDAVASINYYRETATNPAFSSTIGEPEATGDLTVRITSEGPNPEMQRLLGDLLAGSVISAAGLQDPEKLSSETAGAGPYMLDPSATTSGSTYTYVPNPNFYDPSQVHWKKIVFNTVQGSAAALNALRSGQADMAVALDANDAPAAEAAGLQIVSSPAAFLVWTLGQRDAAPLKDERVRQALNYAIDRDAIAKALFGEYGSATTQIQLPGSDGFSEEFDGKYAYDIEKAKSLLADAGYADGFELTAGALQAAAADQMAQAVASDWEKIGVKLKLSIEPPQRLFPDATAKKFQVIANAYGGLPPFLTSGAFIRPIPNAFNPWGLGSPDVTAALEKADAAPEETRNDLYQQAEELAVDQGMFAGVLRFDTIVGVSEKVTGVAVTDQKIIPDISLVTPAS